MTVHIRLANDNDAAGIASVHVAAWQAAYRGLMPDHVLDTLNTDERAHQWRRWLRHADRPTIVADVDGTLAGFCNLRPADDREMQLTAIYVLPDAWGRGYGGRLCERAIEEARDRGCSSIFLWVLEANSRARAFYERMGFTFTGETRIDRDLVAAELSEVKYRMAGLTTRAAERAAATVHGNS